MARQKGSFPFTGTIGGLNFYFAKGDPLVRMAGGGFNGEAIRNSKRMARVRENASEFGHCSRVNKEFRMALAQFVPDHSFKFLHRRLMKLFNQVKNLDDISERGHRRVFVGMEHPRAMNYFRDFLFTPECNVYTHLPYEISYHPKTARLHMSRLEVLEPSFISGTTYLQVQYGLLEFDFETYAQVHHLCPPVLLSQDELPETLHFTPETAIEGVGALFPLLSVSYVQEINGRLYPFKAANSVGFSVVG
jgi:hypothetical protein